MTTVAVEGNRSVEAEKQPSEPPRSRWRRKLYPVAAVATGTAAIGVHGAFYGNWIIDDAAITFAYARSFSEGLGPVVQAGAPPIEGYSNPTWTALLALARLVGLFDHGTIFGIPDYVLFPKALALVLCAGVLTACYKAAQKVTRHPAIATLAIGLALAATPSFVIWIVSGLENPLYALIIVWLAVLTFRAVLDDRLLNRRLAMIAGGLAAAAALTRPEGLIYAGVYPIIVLGRMTRENRTSSIKHIVVSAVTFLVPVGTYFIWRYLEFGQWVSSPSVAKRQGLPDPGDLARPGELVAYTGAPAILLAVAFIGMAIARPAWWRKGLFALLVPLGLAITAYAVLEPDWMAQYRFATPIWVLGALVCVLASIDALRAAKRRGRIWLTIGLVATLIPSAWDLAGAAREFRKAPDISACYVADRFGRTFNAYADILGIDKGSLLLPDLGGSSLTSRLHLVDMAGLVNDRFADLARVKDKPGQAKYVYEEVKPTFIHTRQPWSSGTSLGFDPRLARDYYPIHFDPYQGAPNGDWVRKDAVRDQSKLAEARTYAADKTFAIESNAGNWPRRQCGPTLQVGQTVTGQS